MLNHVFFGFFVALIEALFEIVHRAAEIFADIAQFFVPNTSTTITNTITQCQMEKLPMMLSFYRKWFQTA